MHFIIRLPLESHPPKFTDANGQEVVPSLSRGQKVIYRGLRYKGKVPVNLIGVWKKGRAEPLWVMTDLDPEPALRIYLQRMKIDETFRDWKQLLGLQRQRNKSQEDMEKMVALLLLVYVVGLFVGEKLRDHCYGEPITTSEGVRKKGRKGDKGRLEPGRKWKRYSGLFVLLKQKHTLSPAQWQAIVGGALLSFLGMVQGHVLTHV